MNLIYQYFDGDITPEVEAGVHLMTEYAKTVGVEYMFEHNTDFLQTHYQYTTGNRIQNNDVYFGSLKPLLDPRFDQYDKILYADVDVLPIEGLTDNIFDELTGEVGVVEETFHDRIPPTKLKKLKEWKEEVAVVDVSFNSGVVLYSKQIREKARNWFDLPKYVEWMIDKAPRLNDFENRMPDEYFLTAQPYLQYMLHKNNADIQLLSQDWNGHIWTDSVKLFNNVSEIWNDMRTPTTKFVHCRLRSGNQEEFIKRRIS